MTMEIMVAMIMIMMEMKTAMMDDATTEGWLSESWLVSLDFHHDVVNIDELIFDFHSLEWVLVQDLLEAMVILDQLHQGPLQSIMKN